MDFMIGRKIVLLLLGGSAMLLAGCDGPRQKMVTVRVGSSMVLAEVAKTQMEKEKGLSGRTQLPEGRGMIFVFDSRGRYPFWMQGMKYTLDFIWVDGNKVVETTAGVPVQDNSGHIPVLTPKEVVDRVVEVKAGFVDKYHIKSGDVFEVTQGSL